MSDRDQASLREAEQIVDFADMIPPALMCIIAHIKGAHGGDGKTISENVIRLILSLYPDTPQNNGYRSLLERKPVLLSAFAERISDRLHQAGYYINYIAHPGKVTFMNISYGPPWSIDLETFLKALDAGDPHWTETLKTLVVTKAEDDSAKGVFD